MSVFDRKNDLTTAFYSATKT